MIDMHPRYTIHILNHNYDPKSVLDSLSGQLLNHKIDTQVVVWDDFSAPEYRTVLFDLQSEYRFPFISWKMEPENVGRSVMRQKILESQRSGWLVSLDSDMVPDDDFIEQMVSSLQDTSTVYRGQHYYQSKKPAQPFVLHWTYGRHRELRARSQGNHQHFSTGIFALHSSLTSDLRFDPELTTYGHEDTMFGMQLDAKGIRVEQTAMRALHQGLIEQDRFIDRHLNAVWNMHRVVSRYPDYRSRLITWGDRIQKIPYLSSLVSSRQIRDLCLRRLAGNPENLFYLDLLKLNAWLSGKR